MANAATIEIAQHVRNNFASSALTERQAKLYSQRLRRDMGRDGLASFAPGDVESYLDEAMLLLHCGLLERNANPASGWRGGIKRAAEILEWLSQPSLKPAGAPLHILAAAAYQLADYPAMALGHLRRVPDEPISTVLREFLRANFPATIEATRSFWRDQRTLEVAGRIDARDLTTHTFRHIIMCIGTVCSYLRSGNHHLNERALTKLEHLAASLLHSRDSYSFLLARLTAASCRRFVEICLWPRVEQLREVSGAAASAALTQFARSAFINQRALVWPAQAAGLERLRENTSFVMCTPTGSGKTMVATFAVVQALFADPPHDPPQDPLAQALLLPQGNLVLYLVPSRALAAEVEARLAQDLAGTAAEPVVVTGPYGGVDWGPTDAWIQTGRATVVICTFEKADALIRYLGVLFLDRVRLVVIDEAHMVEQDRLRLAGLEDGSSRALRIEQLGARLLRARNDYAFRVLALSAVAARAAPAMARWISGSPEGLPTTSSYRSTRQMLGRLEVSRAGQYTIRYDLMDGRSLRFDDERRGDTPFVVRPFPPMPGGIAPDDGPEVQMRGPTLWAALQLAAQRPDGTTPSVLISLTQNPESFSATCATLIEGWPAEALPNYRVIDEANDLWTRCLASAADYFTVDSVEYRLLRRGIAVHHGKMPSLLARRLKIVVDRGLVRVIIATSTLSEGVNLPVNFLLIPSVCRGQSVLGLQEFSNLIGRAGRPGFSTEGSALVVLPERPVTRRIRRIPSRQWDGYEELIAGIERATAAAGQGVPEDVASSPLAHLLDALGRAWATLTGGGNIEEFATWLEQTAVVGMPAEAGPAYKYLDSLDAVLIAAIQEDEELRHGELTPNQVELELTAIWRRTYAFAVAREEERLSRIWLARGRAIKTQYPEAAQRRRIYRTSLSPRAATSLIDIAAAVRTKLQEGSDYVRLATEDRFIFVRDVLALLSQVSSFQIDAGLGSQRNFQEWQTLLRWWLAKATLPAQPMPNRITTWYDFVAKNFIYRGAWGLGSIVGLLMDDTEDGQPVRALEIEDWPRSGLPWIAFWMKELIAWGTLDPVAAYLLARGDAIDRRQAEADGQLYYDRWPQNADANEILDPRRIRDWLEVRRVQQGEGPMAIRELVVEATLARAAADYVNPRLTVTPLEIGGELVWIDSAGYSVAQSERPVGWPAQPSSFEFELNVTEERIVGEAYMRHG